MDIAIVGAGFTGTMLAVHLTRRPGARVALFERGAHFAQGVAYSTRHACHLLNVSAGHMSAFPDDPGHFLRWATGRDPAVGGESFLPRRTYAEYLRDVFRDAEQSLPPGAALARHPTEAVALAPRGAGKWEVRGTDGRHLGADAVLLAIGNYPPADPPCATPEFYAGPRYRRDPWAPDALDVDPARDVLLLGTGLTMIDVAVALHERGHRGRILAISRRGLLPQTHRHSTTPPPHLPAPASVDGWRRTALGLLRELRADVDARARDGFDWRDVLTSMRPITCSLWVSLPADERRRFLRHLRPYWESHRHRTAPAIGRTVQDLRDADRLRVLAGRALRYDVRGDEVEATLRRRGAAGPERVRVARVINCTGPDTDLTRVADPLVQDLRRHGRIRPDALGLGIDTDESGHVLDQGGAVQPGLYLAGPLRRGQLWENVAVPELRDEAQRLARTVADEYRAHAAGA